MTGLYWKGVDKMPKTGSEKVLDELRKTLIKANRQARAKETVSRDRMVALSKLANAYTKMVAATVPKESERDPNEWGDPTFYSSLSK